MKLRLTRSEVDPNHCSKVVDDRPLIPTPSEDDLFLLGADPLICKSKRELDSRFGMVNNKPATTSMELNFQKLCGRDTGPDLGNAFEFQKPIQALMFLVNSYPDICFAVSMMSSYMVGPHWIGTKNFPRYLQDTISHGLRYTTGNVKLHDYSNTNWAGSVENRKSTSECWFSSGFVRYPR